MSLTSRLIDCSGMGNIQILFYANQLYCSRHSKHHVWIKSMKKAFHIPTHEIRMKKWGIGNKKSQEWV